MLSSPQCDLSLFPQDSCRKGNLQCLKLRKYNICISSRTSSLVSYLGHSRLRGSCRESSDTAKGSISSMSIGEGLLSPRAGRLEHAGLCI